MRKTMIKNAKIYDGTKKPAFSGGIMIIGDTITAVEDVPASEDYETIIDAGGLAVCPGFIDTHSHSDVLVLTEKVILPKIRQGITTEMLGQDGVAMAPIPAEYAEDWRRNIGGLNGDSDQISWVYDSIDDYFRAIERQSPCSNFACLSPHGNIRLAVMGFSDKPATDEEMTRMETILDRQLREGAAGLSTGLIYIPCVYSQTEELVRLCRVAKKYNRPFVVHQRNQDEKILESMDELMHIVRESGVRLHISHLQVAGDETMRFDLYRKMEEIAALGVEVTADQYPYTAGSTMMGAMIPAWAHVGGTSRLLERLADSKEREKIKRDILIDDERESKTLNKSNYDRTYVSSVNKPHNQKFVGKNLTEVGEMTGKEPIDAMMDLLLDEENKVGKIQFYTTEECIMDHMIRPEVNMCTDGLLGGKPHPRVYGTFPRFLGKYARENELMSMEEAVYKTTKKAADAMGLTDRGSLEVGKKADLVIFDPDTIIDVATFENPRQYAQGIKRVLVNGVTVVEDDKVYENAACGTVIRLL
ncbi:N-acyl-D-amino-acid deacylase [Desulfitobacterium sp. LBE]|uniref:N-acyl-D-amino-acid deacylase family protein n=1 Tax=Desulfitobacterium sp. LBE TaxID=884086 RepID=UPI00119BFA93|nr:D-aminoacylase [Desulfitobacterium sp. LBE]TWH58080.1 N-acyl-D-amino-acid deacylase [Desulfitobacterium sp. LBE]